MRILVLGGTGCIGRHVVETLLDAGHFVSSFSRGELPDELPDRVERLRGDRDKGARGIAALARRSWDACVDISGYTPRAVRPSAEILRDCVNRYVFVSAVAVYGDPTLRPVTEDHPRVAPASEDVTEVVGEMYARLKVTCENIVHDIYGERATILRPQIVVGPHDQTGRYTYWLQRAELPGPMLAPGDGQDHVQFIDVRDVARFTRTVIESNLSGGFNLAGPRLTWRNFIELLGAKNAAWVPAEIIKCAGVTEFELPMFRTEGGPKSGLMDVSNEKARQAGLTLTDPAATLQDTRAWLGNRPQPPMLSVEMEAELIQKASTDVPRLATSFVCRKTTASQISSLFHDFGARYP